MLALAFVWLALLVVELIWGESLLFEIIGTIIWVIFILDFAMEFVLAPHKAAYLKHNWLLAMALLIPALRLFRVFRVFRLLRLARVGRSLRLLRVVSSLNRGVRALGASLSRRGFGYVWTRDQMGRRTAGANGGHVEAMRDADIIRGEGPKPRIHDIRHAFAVHRLLRWYREGVDVQKRLVLLSTFMGHISIYSTQVNLTITGSLLGEATPVRRGNQRNPQLAGT
jgi:hypothetical protein